MNDDEVVADLVGLLRGRQVFPVGGEHGKELARAVLGEVECAGTPEIGFRVCPSPWELLAVDDAPAFCRPGDQSGPVEGHAYR